MTLKATAFDPALDYKIVHQDDCTNTVNVNAAGGPCRLMTVDIDNAGGSAACYLRLVDEEAVTAGSSVPTSTFKCPGGDTVRVNLPMGKYFQNLNFWATRNSNPVDNTAPAMSGSNKLLVTLIVQPE